MSTALEERYRSLLRILPADYRAEWEEEMVATFLAASLPEDPEDAEFVAEFVRPPIAEVASVVGLAVRLRLPGAGAAARPRLMGDAVRLVALIGLLVGAATGAVGTVVHLWFRPGFLATTQVLLVATALPAYLALVMGHRSLARTLASISIGAVLFIGVADLVAGHPFLAGRWLAALLDLVIVAALWAHHDDAPPVPRRPWLLALPAAIAVAAGAFVATAAFGAARWSIDWPAMSCAVVAVALAVHLARGGPPEWSSALAVLGAVVLVQRLVTLPEFVAGTTVDHRTVVLVVGLAEAAAVALAAVPAALRARRDLRAPATISGR